MSASDRPVVQFTRNLDSPVVSVLLAKLPMDHKGHSALAEIRQCDFIFPSNVTVDEMDEHIRKQCSETWLYGVRIHVDKIDRGHACALMDLLHTKWKTGKLGFTLMNLSSVIEPTNVHQSRIWLGTDLFWDRKWAEESEPAATDEKDENKNKSATNSHTAVKPCKKAVSKDVNENVGKDVGNNEVQPELDLSANTFEETCASWIHFVEVPPDGNCFFHAFINGLSDILKAHPEHQELFPKLCKKAVYLPPTISTLRLIVSDRILNNKHAYEELVADWINDGQIDPQFIMTPKLAGYGRSRASLQPTASSRF